jgi:uncharacterized protein (TIGR02246 family)
MKNRSSLRTYRPCLGAAVAAAFALVAAPARAADAKAAPAAKASSPDAEIRATALAFVQAFDRGDAKTVAAQWLPEGTAAEADGTMYKGREAIEREYAQLFKQYPDARVSVAVKSIEFPAPTVAIEDGVSQVTAQHAGPTQVARYTAVHVKVDGKWLVASVREANVELPSNFAKIEGLGWLVGTWTAKREGNNVRTTIRWIANNSFLEREYTVANDGIVSSSGRQIIGWDPKIEKIRSWSFDASGGYGTGVWTRTPEGWQIEQSGVLADGTPTSSRDTLVRIPGEDNVFGFRSSARTAGDTRLADVPEVVLDRVPAKSAKAK